MGGGSLLTSGGLSGVRRKDIKDALEYRQLPKRGTEKIRSRDLKRQQDDLNTGLLHRTKIKLGEKNLLRIHGGKKGILLLHHPLCAEQERLMRKDYASKRKRALGLEAIQGTEEVERGTSDTSQERE